MNCYFNKGGGRKAVVLWFRVADFFLARIIFGRKIKDIRRCSYYRHFVIFAFANRNGVTKSSQKTELNRKILIAKLSF